jgi:hypothetical protein
VRLQIQDAGCQVQQFGSRLRHRACRASHGKADGVLRVGVDGEKGLRQLGGGAVLGGALAAHVPLAMAAQSVRIDR